MIIELHYFVKYKCKKLTMLTMQTNNRQQACW